MTNSKYPPLRSLATVTASKKAPTPHLRTGRMLSHSQAPKPSPISSIPKTLPLLSIESFHPDACTLVHHRSQPQVTQPRMLIRPTPQRPMILPLRFLDRQIID